MRPGPDRNWRLDMGGAEEVGVRFAEACFSPGECVIIRSAGHERSYRVIHRQQV